jgi:hypothetical protein
MLSALKRMDRVSSNWLGSSEGSLQNIGGIPDFTKDQFEMADHIHCFRPRGIPEKLWESFVQLISICYDESDVPSEGRRESLSASRGKCNFCMLVTKPGDAETVIAGCIIRIIQNKETEVPYLYVHTAATLNLYRGIGLARQMGYAAYALGTLIVENKSNEWGVRPGNRWDLVVAVDQTKKTNKDLYENFGLKTYEPGITTDFQPAAWLVEPGDLYTMYTSIGPKVIYADADVIIYLPHYSDADCVHLNHYFPKEKYDAVKRHGLIPSRRNCVYPKSGDTYFASSFKSVHFMLLDDQRDFGVFTVKAKLKKDVRAVNVTIAVPPWFAVSIR